MRNYIILNNKSSNDINGLIIQELAPISKPQQRTQVETIDGRDGDIVTPLGYAAYNKKIKIGLYGNFNINDIIAYFATKGTAIFSNEPDKYYNYQILDQIDYERLVRYRVATVTMHVQPFKYSATEGTLTIDASDTVSGEGSEIALDNTAEAPFNVLRHKGNATQKTYSGKNLLSLDKHPPSANTNMTVTHGVSDLKIVAATTTGAQYASIQIDLDATKTYTLSGIGKKIVKGTDGRPSVQVRWRGTNDNGATWTPWANIFDSGSNPAQGTAYPFSGSFNGYARYQISFYNNSQTPVTVGETTEYYDLQLEVGSQATDYEIFVGGTASPNPDYPQDISVLTGDSSVKITSKNHFYIEPQTINGVTLSYSPDGAIVLNGTSNASFTAFRQSVSLDGTYNLSIVNPTAQANTYIRTRNSANSILHSLAAEQTTYVKNQTKTGNIATLEVSIGASGITYDNFKIYAQLEAGDQPSDYEPYKGQSYVIPFGDTYLAAIGDYADEPVKVGDTWYIRRKIGKVVLDGTQTISSSGTPNLYFARSQVLEITYIAGGLSDYFAYNDGNITDNTTANNIMGDNQIAFRKGNETARDRLYIKSSKFANSTEFITWLTTHPTTVYYVLATPTDEEITDQALIDALDDFYEQAHAYKGRTHITATAQGDNAPAVLSVEVGENNESTVTNAGNTTSRPIITIYGQGNIGMYINDVEVLDIALGDEQYITIDSAAMEAYKDTTANLKNRLVTGDYSKLALNAGDNKIYFTGIVTKYEISKYSRWL